MSDLLKKLREPFRKEELEFRVGATNNDKSMGLALAYVQARAIQNRLDELFGVDGWTVSYKEISAGFICSLSIKINDRWVTKEDGAGMTEYESVKGESQMLLKEWQVVDLVLEDIYIMLRKIGIQ